MSLEMPRLITATCLFVAAALVMSACAASTTLDDAPSSDALTSQEAGSDTTGDDSQAASQPQATDQPDQTQPQTADQPDQTQPQTADQPDQTQPEAREVPAGVELATATDITGDITFALMPPSDLDGPTCEAIAAWFESFSTLPGVRLQQLERGTDLSELLEATEIIEAMTDGEAAIYFRQWANNLVELQDLIDSAAPFVEPSTELIDAHEAIRDQLSIYDTTGIEGRIWEHCVLRGPSGFNTGSRFNFWGIEARDAIVFSEGGSLTVGDIELTNLRTAAMWVDPWFGLQYGGEYRATQDPWLYVDFTMTNTGDRTFDHWDERPFPVFTPSGAILNSMILQSPDIESGFRALGPGESRETAFAIELDSGYLQPDGTRDIPEGISAWVLGFGTAGESGWIAVGGNDNPAVERDGPAADAPEPDSSSVAGSDDQDSTSAEQLEADEITELLVGLLDSDASQEACIRQFVGDNIETILNAASLDTVMTDLATTCSLQRSALRVGLEFHYSVEVTSCMINAMEPDQINRVWLAYAQLEGDAATTRLDEFAFIFPECV